MKESELEEMWDSVHAEAVKYGISVITGHTARYTGCSYPMVGGATSIAVGGEARSPRARRGCGRATASSSPRAPPSRRRGSWPCFFRRSSSPREGQAFQKEAAAVFSQMTVMEDCAVARKFRGVHVMHDATECGVWGGLYEMARAGGYGLRIEEEAIPVQPVIRKTAELFRFDPFSAISEGTLIAMVDRKDAGGLIGALKDEGIPAAVAGEVVAPGEGMKIIGREGERALEHPKVDPYWTLAAEFSK